MFRDLNPSTLLSPVPVVLVSCAGVQNEYKKDNMLTIAWTGIVNSEPPMASVSVRKSRFSFEQIVQSGEFCINLISEDMVKQLDWCGVKSGKNFDKFKETGLTALHPPELKYAPMVGESPLVLCCRVKESSDLGSHVMFVGEIVAVKVQEELLDDAGKLTIEKAKLVCYNHGDYHAIGKKLGFFGFSIAAPDVLKRRMK